MSTLKQLILSSEDGGGRHLRRRNFFPSSSSSSEDTPLSGVHERQPVMEIHFGWWPAAAAVKRLSNEMIRHVFHKIETIFDGIKLISPRIIA